MGGLPKDETVAPEVEDPVPPYRASHGFATEAEEQAALREFAESKLYCDPQTNGSIMHTGLVQPYNPEHGSTHPAREQYRQLKAMERAKKVREAGEQLGKDQKDMKEREKAAKKDTDAEEQRSQSPEFVKERRASVFDKFRNMVAGDKDGSKCDSVIR